MSEFITRIPSLLVALSVSTVIMYLPGSAILFRLRALRRLDALSRLCIAPGVSVALYVVLFEVAEVLHLRLGWWTPWLIVLLALASLLSLRPKLPRITWTPDTPAYIVFAIVAVVILTTRLTAIEGLVAPLWGDSVHHTVIVQLMLDNGGLFQSWQPYDDATSFTYHYGFHALTTMYAWMRGMSAEFAVLLMGQIANTSAVVALYALTRQWTKSPWGGVFAMIAGGLISTYPYSFLNWGRYTQLTGHIVLIAALVLLSFYLSRPRARGNVPVMALLAVVIAGIGLSQYKVAVLFVVFSLALVIFQFFTNYLRRRDLLNALIASFGRTSVVALLALLVFLPRGFDIVSTNLGNAVQNRLSVDIPESKVSLTNRPLPDALKLSQSGLDNDDLWLWWIAVIGVGIMVVGRRNSLWFPAGAALCLLAVDPRIVGINRIGLVDEFHLSLTVYIVLAPIVGLAVGVMLELLTRRIPQIGLIGAFCAAASLIIGVTHLPSIPAEAIFVQPEDISMMHWIRNNVPQSSRIATIGFIGFNTFTVGRDAGWWLPFYTGNRTNLMLMAAGMESTTLQRTSQSELTFTQQLYKRDMALQSSADWLVSHGYRFFYIGAKPLVAEPDQAKLVEQLLANPYLHESHRIGDAILLAVAP